MSVTTDVQSRIESLNAEFTNTVRHYQRLARLNYRFALVLMICTLGASGVAGIGGIFFGLKAEATGGIALLPGILALVATVLKPQGRANWHYRKKDALNALRRSLLYELPESPTAADVAKIASAWAALDTKMNDEWEKNFALNWSQFAAPPDQQHTEVAPTTPARARRPT
jgi:hypothetical protein